MNVVRQHMRVGFAAWCLVAMLFGQALFLPAQAGATGEVGRPPLPDGIVRLPFDGSKEIFNVPGCHEHSPDNPLNQGNPYTTALNTRAFDFGLYLEPVLAAGEGDIVNKYEDNAGAKILVIAHGRQEGGSFVHNGVRSFYVHLQDFNDQNGTEVEVGQHVQAGEKVATSGNTGLGAAYHLHFAVTEGNTEDRGSYGVAANTNDLPGILWDINQLNSDGYVTNCQASDEWTSDAPVAQQPEARNPEASDGGSLTVPIFDRDSAVAAAYGAFSNGAQFSDDSANFVSQALWGGGLPRTDGWDDAILSNPDNLVNYLIGTRPYGEDASITLGTKIPLNWSNDVPTGASLGDVIAYDYEGDGNIDHVAIVTGFTNDGPTVTEHSPSHQDRYWTYSEEDSAWIAEAHPGAVAYLIQIVPTTLPNF